MCGRATLTVSPEELRETFGLVDTPADMPARFNIAPSQSLPVIREWGRLVLLPWGVKERRIINVRLERATTKPEGRCLVVVDGFYEWRDADKEPFYFRRHDRRAFALGGVVLGKAAAVVTSDPLSRVAELHDRMPLVLAEKDWKGWLAGAKPDPTLEGFECYAVSKLVNSPKNDDARLLEPVASPA